MRFRVRLHGPEEGPRRPETVFAQARPLMVGRGLSMVVTSLIPLVLARHLDRSGFGTYKQAFLIASTLHSILQFGMAQSLYYFLPGSGPRQGSYVTQSFLAMGLFGLVGGLLLVATGPAAARLFHNPEVAEISLLLGSYTFLLTAATPLEPALTAVGRLRAAAAAYILTDLVRALGILLPTALGGGIKGVMAGATASAALRYGAALLAQTVGLIPRGRPDRRLLREHIAYALPFGGAVTLGVLHVNFHSFYVSAVTVPAVFALYAVGCFQIPIVNLLYGPVTEVMMVRIAEESRRGRKDTAPAIFGEASARLTLAFLPLAAFLMAVAPDLIPALFTEQYRASVPIFVVAMLEVPLAGLPTDGLVRSLGDTRFLVLANVVRLGVALLLVPAGLWAFGLPGAVGGHVCSVAVNKAMVLWRGWRILGCRGRTLLPVRSWAFAALLAAGGGFLTAAARHGLGLSGASRLASLFGATALFGVVFVGGVVAVRLRSAARNAAVPLDGRSEGGDR